MLTLIIAWLAVAPLAAVAAARVIRRREGGLDRARRLRALMVSGLAVGTTSHAVAFLRAGLMPAPALPLFYNRFWTALTLIDPLIAVAIVLWPRPGIVATIALMIADVTINVTASGGFADWAIWGQTAYGVFVMAATPYCWKRTAPLPGR
jgi:hypothetical protein